MIKYIKNEGEVMPPFYYGLAYRDWVNYKEIYYWMPICYIVQAFKWLRNKWYKIQHIESPNDRIIKVLREEAIKNANKVWASISKEQNRYYNAYIECMKVMTSVDYYIPKEIIDRIRNIIYK